MLWMYTATGYGALACSLCYRIPQLVKLVRTRRGTDISLWMLNVQNASYVLYTIYGVGINDTIYIVSSLLGLVQNLAIAGLVKRYANVLPVTTHDIVGVVTGPIDQDWHETEQPSENVTHDAADVLVETVLETVPEIEMEPPDTPESPVETATDSIEDGYVLAELTVDTGESGQPVPPTPASEGLEQPEAGEPQLGQETESSTP